MPGGAGREAQQQHQQQEQQEQPHVQQSLPGVQAPPLRVGAGTPLGARLGWAQRPVLRKLHGAMQHVLHTCPRHHRPPPARPNPTDPEQAAQLEAHPSEASALGLPEAIKLGLGDFIFYSVLVRGRGGGQAAGRGDGPSLCVRASMPAAADPAATLSAAHAQPHARTLPPTFVRLAQVGRAAMYDFLTVFACYLAIIAGA